MGLLDFLKPNAPQLRQHDDFDVLAAISKLAAIKERSHAFYQKHHTVVEPAVDFIALLKSQHRDLSLTLASSDSTCELVAKNLRAVMSEQTLPDNIKSVIDSNIKTLIPQFAALLRDSSRPRFLDDCVWIADLAPSIPEVQVATLQASI